MKKLLKISTISVLILGLTFGLYSYKVNHASASCGNGFSFCRTVSIDHTKVPNTDQASFPVLVCFNGAAPCNTSLAGLNQTGAGNHVANSNGYDIIFTTDSACTTQVTAWEIETYVASTGELEAWVNDGTISHTVDTVFYMCYGKASISTFQSTASNVWDTNFKGVYHLPNGTSLSSSDSSVNAHTGTQANTTATAGQVDGAASFNGSTSDIDMSSSTDFNFDRLSTMTVSLWAKFNSFQADNVADMALVGRLSGTSPFPGWSFEVCGFDPAYKKLQFYMIHDFNAPNVIQVFGSTVLTTGTWYHLTMTYSGSSTGAGVKFYVNGASETPVVNRDSLTLSLSQTANAFIGARNASGNFVPSSILDEVQISNSVRSADWDTTEFNNQNSPSTFETFGAESSSAVASAPMVTIINASFIIKNSTLRIIGN